MRSVFVVVAYSILIAACSNGESVRENNDVALEAERTADRQAEQACLRDLPLMSENAVRQLLSRGNSGSFAIPDAAMNAIVRSGGMETSVYPDETGACVYAQAKVDAVANGTKYKFTTLCYVDTIGSNKAGEGLVQSVKRCTSW